MKIVKCLSCNKELRHFAKGMCASCYNYSKRDKDKSKGYVLKWKNKNPDYFKNYYLNNKDKYKKNKNDISLV